MDLLQWNVSRFHTRFFDVWTLMQCWDPAIICLQETHLPYIKPLWLFSYLDSDRAIGGTPLLVKDCVHPASPNLHSPPQATGVWLNLQHLSYTSCSTYFPPGVPIAPEDLTSLISQLPPPFIFLGNSFCAGSDLLLLKSGAATCLSLGSETFSAWDLAFCRPSWIVCSCRFAW
jgi:hypothetical protein